ncbi:ubiquitin-conjugating enzyme/RWD-like protein [Halteromyces radiatus]|uniref:ubiquitin-conjugating enzyme/RWD-like protein n=1 Tax=Halteromyces radiatus TaxID=101107 RepID=UPI00221F5873|nr:ubiquitin-conjugating enzyme/RWD-like protein [Halteromyces radiatus]KAI8076912.1 ubiquitin-conjugating enzyme/RWD-like protein [Halteromyces radiatus]
MYLIPCADTLNVLYGVIFLHHGLYNSGVFKFRVTIPENYPYSKPLVTFLTDVFHPLIGHQGHLSLSQAFPPTRHPYQGYLIHLLHYIKNIFYKPTMDGLLLKHCVDKEAYRLYREDAVVFGKLAQQCAKLSITELYVFDHFPDNNLIRFSPLDEETFDIIKSYLLRKYVQNDGILR